MHLDKIIEFLKLPEEEALKKCREDSFCGSGPGGQHRNRVKTGIKLTHIESNLSGEASQFREGKRNRKEALRQLKLKMSFTIEISFKELEQIWNKLPIQRINANNPRYPIWVLCVIQLWRNSKFQTSELKQQDHWSVSSIIRQCARDSELWTWIQKERQLINLKPLKNPLK